MRNLILILPIFLVLSLTACRQTNAPVTPSPHDLSGLEGEWTYDVTFRGTLEGWMKIDDVYEREYGTFFITTDKVYTEYAKNLYWYYDGEVLVISMRVDEYDYSEPCGSVNLSIFARLEINIRPGQTHGTIHGDSDATLSTDFCDYSSGSLNNSGSIDKT